ncbi:hypothetical protein NVI2019_PEGOAJLN_00848 [Providencia alcalifaciens]|uniref:DUF2732 domain-containing protein n=1 Tax=Providencia alcalifaciens DSM 30120 TaxID=520999 RepID=B6XAG8_9GAMM|nr:DUF2732 family protein [Providencia alcalifaciens]ATG14912.1 DUF2732 domain-containing protein [Providencia alcalifaciens]EEB47721.1 hypothetical protein PROVALCAL_00316 [Providencia alcalifaciens DSM 30120]ETT00487.1 PF10809 family protein [Providencia alcalifaciens PAL-3]EUC98433.1 PF10809 family protein [Providencia alcalifaciens PAL-1]EUD04151.1 PF10809 family protein [Providencia alcalifaciens RIMD 1656011]
MKNKETKNISIGFGIATNERDFAAMTISAIRNDERKSLFDMFSSRLDAIACKAIKEKMAYDQIHQLLIGESEHFSNLAAELDHV